MSISKKDAQLLLGFAGVLVAVLVFFFVYKPLTEKSLALKTENVTLEARIADLETKVAKKAFYESETARMKAEVDAVYSEFPSFVMAEDVITLGIIEQATAPMEVTGITIDVPDQLYLVSQNAAAQMTETETVPADGTATQAVSGNTIGLYNQPMKLSYNVSYEGLKRSIDYICKNPNRMTIGNITAAYDNTTGLLTGSTDVNMYFLSGTGKPYTAPSLAGVPMGTNNLFGTVNIPGEAQNETEDSEE